MAETTFIIPVDTPQNEGFNSHDGSDSEVTPETCEVKTTELCTELPRQSSETRVSLLKNSVSSINNVFELFNDGSISSNALSEQINDEVTGGSIDLNMRNEEGKTLLHLAAESSFEEIIHLLIEKGCKVNMADKKGNTPLDLALKAKNVIIIKMLLKFNALSRSPTLFHSAVQVTNIEIIQLLLSECYGVDAVNDQGQTALHLAAINGSEEMIDCFLKAGADFKIKCNKGQIALHYAANSNSDNVVKKLIEVGSNVEEPDHLGLTPLSVASSNGNTQSVVMMLQYNANINSPSLCGLTPLHLASIRNNISVVRILVKAGADINVTSLEGFTPLALAEIAGNVAISNELIQWGASINLETVYRPLNVAAANGQSATLVKILQDETVCINDEDSAGKTPLFRACENGHLDAVKVLLKYKADVMAVCTDNKVTAIHAAANNGFSEVILCLVLAGANLEDKDRMGNTPLHTAVLRGHIKAAEELIIGKSCLKHRNNDGNLPIHLAATSGKLDMVKLLIKYGADVTAINKDGFCALHLAAASGGLPILTLLPKVSVDTLDNSDQTCLHIAAIYDQYNIAEYLISQGANVNSVDVDGFTALHLAAERGHINIMKLLLTNKAQTNEKVYEVDEKKYIDKNNKQVEKSYYGETPLHLAAYIEDDGLSKEAVEVLLKAGADLSTGDYRELTPLHISAKKGHIKTSKLLFQNGADADARNDNGKTPLDLIPPTAKKDFYFLN